MSVLSYEQRAERRRRIGEELLGGLSARQVSEKWRVSLQMVYMCKREYLEAQEDGTLDKPLVPVPPGVVVPAQERKIRTKVSKGMQTVSLVIELPGAYVFNVDYPDGVPTGFEEHLIHVRRALTDEGGKEVSISFGDFTPTDRPDTATSTIPVNKLRRYLEVFKATSGDDVSNGDAKEHHDSTS